MKKFIGTVDKGKNDKLLNISYRLNALKDLKSTLKDLDGDYSTVDHRKIKIADVEKEILDLIDKKEKILEEIRIQKGWSEENMAKIHIMENCKAYIDIGDGK